MKYQDLLRGELKILGHFIDEYFEAKTDLDAINIAVEKTLPYIFMSPLVTPIINNWRKDERHLRKDYVNRVKKLRIRVIKVLELISVGVDADYNEFIKSVQQFISNTDDYDGAGSASDLEKSRAFSSQSSRYSLYKRLIESAREIIKQDTTFNNIKNVISIINQLLERLLQDEKYNIIKDYVTISRDQETRKPKITISDFTPYFDELATIHDALFGWYNVTNPSIAIKHLELIEWVSKKPYSFLDSNKNVREGNKYQAELFYMYLKVWNEINSVRKNESTKNNELYILKRSHLDRCIKLVINDIISQQDLDRHSSVEIPHNLSLYMFAIRLNKRDNVFFLEVQYARDGRIVNKFLASFKNINSGRYKIADGLVNKQHGITIYEGSSVPKFLTYTKLDGLIGGYILPSVSRSEFEIRNWYTTVCIDEQPDVSVSGILYIKSSDKELAMLISEINKLQSLPE